MLRYLAVALGLGAISSHGFRTVHVAADSSFQTPAHGDARAAGVIKRALDTEKTSRIWTQPGREPLGTATGQETSFPRVAKRWKLERRTVSGDEPTLQPSQEASSPQHDPSTAAQQPSHQEVTSRQHAPGAGVQQSSLFLPHSLSMPSQQGPPYLPHSLSVNFQRGPPYLPSYPSGVNLPHVLSGVNIPHVPSAQYLGLQHVPSIGYLQHVPSMNRLQHVPSMNYFGLAQAPSSNYLAYHPFRPGPIAVPRGMRRTDSAFVGGSPPLFTPIGGHPPMAGPIGGSPPGPMGGSPPWLHSLLETPQPSAQPPRPGLTAPRSLHPNLADWQRNRIEEEEAQKAQKRPGPGPGPESEPLWNVGAGQIRYDREASHLRQPARGAPADKREDAHAYRLAHLRGGIALVLFGLWGRQSQRCVAHLRRDNLAYELRKVQVADWEAKSGMLFVPRAAGPASDVSARTQNQLMEIDRYLRRQGVEGLKVYPYHVPETEDKWNTVTVYPKLTVWFNNKRVGVAALLSFRASALSSFRQRC